jgi:hypothetical protein
VFVEQKAGQVDWPAVKTWNRKRGLGPTKGGWVVDEGYDRENWKRLDEAEVTSSQVERIEETRIWS